MSEMKINVEYTLAREIEGEIVGVDISEQIHEAAVDGVVNCGGYDVDIQTGSDDYVDVNLSGSVSVYVDTDSLIESDLEDVQEVDPFDADVDTIEISPSWRSSDSVDITYTARIEQEVEHELTVPIHDIVLDVKTIRNASTELGRDALRTLLVTLLGREFVEAFENDEL